MPGILFNSRRRTLYLLPCFLQLSFCFTSHSSSPTRRETFNHEGHVLGAFSEQLNSSLFYQTYVPLILKFRIPDWREENLRLNRSLICQDDTMTQSHLCPTAYHLQEIISPVSHAMRFYRNIFSASGGDFYEHNFSCDKIKPHFLHFSTNLGGLLPYLSEYRNRCPLGKNVSLVGKSVMTGMTQEPQQAFRNIQKLHGGINPPNPLNGHGDSYPYPRPWMTPPPTTAPPPPGTSSSAEWKYVEMAGYTALQNSLLMSQYVESVRWANAFTTCQSYKLDVSLVSPLLLNDSLSSLERNLRGNGYAFTLPFMTALPHYYKIPLVDCILTMSNSVFNVGFNWNGKMDWMIRPPLNGANATANLIVRILVPVKKSDLSHKLIKLNKVPYLRNDKGVDKICEIINFQPDDVYLVETNLTSGVQLVVGKVSPYCLSSKLCKVPETTHRQVIDPCVSGIIMKNHEATARNCFFDCVAVPNSQLARDKAFPIVTQLAPNKYSVTGLPLEGWPQMLLQCNGRTTHAFHPNTTEGAILVTLPCSCQIAYGTKTFTAREPCDEPFDVEHVIEFGAHHHKEGGSPLGEKDFIDYLIEALDSQEYNLTYSEKAPNGSANGTSKLTGDNDQNQKTASNPQQQQMMEGELHGQQYHCGHVVLWIFLITLLILNSLTIFILYKNRLVSFNMLLFRGNTGNLQRFENDIPVSNLGSSDPF